MKLRRNKHFRWLLITVLLLLMVVTGFYLRRGAPVKHAVQENTEAMKQAANGQNQSDSVDADEDASVPESVSISDEDVKNQPKDTSALGGYDVLIADRGNNRIVEVTPDKKIVWEYHFDLPHRGLGADDAFFIDGGKAIIVNLEEYHQIEIIDYKTKQVTWSYGHPGQPGSDDGYLNTPDDAYMLANGNIIVADIKNCRVIEIAPDKHIVHQYGVTGVCDNAPGYLNKPNGDTPLTNGHTYISNIVSASLVELDDKWQPVFNMSLPVAYPSDPQPTQAGNILVADYSNPGQLVEVDKQGNVVWQFSGEIGDKHLKQPSLAIELPNGNILCNDDLNHRVIVIDKKTKKIIWQYGITGKPGNGNDQLSIPDGVDIRKAE